MTLCILVVNIRILTRTEFVIYLSKRFLRDISRDDDCVRLNSHLTWKSHIRNLLIKLPRISGILHSLRNMFPVVILQKLYVSLVCPQLTYGLLAWGSKCDLLVTQQRSA